MLLTKGPLTHGLTHQSQALGDTWVPVHKQDGSIVESLWSLCMFMYMYMCMFKTNQV